MVAVLGPILTGIGLMVQGLGGLATGFAGIMGLVARFTGVLVSLAGGWNIVVVAMRGILALVGGMLSWPVALGAAFGVLVVTVAQHWDAIVATITGALDAVQDAAQSATDAIQDWFGSAFDWIADKIESVLDWAAEKLEAIKALVQSVFSGGGGGSGSGAPGFAGGGRVRGPGTGTSDSILARLSTGEFVIRARAVQHYGAQVFERLNRMTMPRTLVPAFAGGGLVAADAGAERRRRGRGLRDREPDDRRRGVPRADGAARDGRAADPLRDRRGNEESRPAAGMVRGRLMLYRTQDLARWGAGKGSNLLPVEIDENNWEIEGRLQAVEAAAGEAANGIANVTVTGSQMTV